MNLSTNKDQPGWSGGEAEFSVTLQCKVTRIVKAGGCRQLVKIEYEGGDKRTFTMNQDMDILGDQEGVRDVLRGLLRTVMPL